MALLHVNFNSETLSMNTRMDVILPERAEGQIGMGGSAQGGCYPTLYLLHGMSDDHTIWQRRTSIERYAADKGIAVVMPTTHLGWYTDMDIGYPYWTFISEELPAICRDMFPRMSKSREDTFVAGLSMGGYGALKCGLRASGTFSCAAGLSSAADVAGLMENLRQSGESTYWTDIFGAPDKVRGSFNDLFCAAKELAASGQPRPRLYMWCGEQDGLLASNIALRDELCALGYDLTYEQSPGDHQWKYWDEKIKTVLNWLPLSKEAK